MTTKGQTKYRPPLTREQQATVVQWRGLGIKYMLKALHGRGLGHFEDEAEGLAHVALCEAVRVWVPERGPFPSCLKWWVSSVANKFQAHGARTVQQSEHAREYVDGWSLDAPISRRWSDRSTMNGGETWQDFLVDDSASDPTQNLDAQRLARAIPLVLRQRMLRAAKTPKAREYAEDSVSMWWERAQAEEFGEIPLEAFAHMLGVSRERVRQRVDKVQQEFERWAAELREEAA